MSVLLVCTAFCLLHLGIGVFLGSRLKAPKSVAVIAGSSPQFVRLEVQELVRDWTEIRSRIEQFVSAVKQIELMPSDLLAQSLADLTQMATKLRSTMDEKPTIDKPIRAPATPEQPAVEPSLSNAQIVELLETDKSAGSVKVRHRFPIKQPMASFIDDTLPLPDSFQLVQCHDLSVKEIRYFQDERPVGDRVVIGLGHPSPVKWVVAEILDYRIVAMYGRTGYLVTGQFVASIDMTYKPENVTTGA